MCIRDSRQASSAASQGPHCASTPSSTTGGKASAKTLKWHPSSDSEPLSTSHYAPQEVPRDPTTGLRHKCLPSPRVPSQATRRNEHPSTQETARSGLRSERIQPRVASNTRIPQQQRLSNPKRKRMPLGRARRQR
eukprot:5926950-Pyramimonas_sp.AAC.1